MPTARVVVAVVALVTLVAIGGVAGGLGDSGADGVERTPPGPPGSDVLDAQSNPDAVEISVTVRANGTARWRVIYLFRLDSTNETEAWESLREDVRRNTSTYVDRFARRMRETVGGAENATGRSMTATGFAVRTELRSAGQFGAVVYSFRWRNFAVVEGDRIRVGDAIEGFYLAEDTKLTLRWPSDYTARSVDPEGDASRENAVVWRGSETDFVAGEPSVVLRRGGGSAVVQPLVLGAVALVVAAALVGGGLVYLRRRDDRPVATVEREGGTTERETTGEGNEATTAGSDPSSEEPPEELLSNEERVMKLLRERGGRMKQQEVVEELGWTEAKTSQVVRDLRDEGEIEGFRLGRENVLTLPEVDPLEGDSEDDESDGE